MGSDDGLAGLLLFHWRKDHVLVYKRKQKKNGANGAATDEKHAAMQMATSLDLAT